MIIIIIYDDDDDDDDDMCSKYFKFQQEAEYSQIKKFICPIPCVKKIRKIPCECCR